VQQTSSGFIVQDPFATLNILDLSDNEIGDLDTVLINDIQHMK